MGRVRGAIPWQKAEGKVRAYPSSQDAAGLRIGVVVSRFNAAVGRNLLDGCVAALARCGARAEDVHVAWVPGAFEIPLAALEMARSGRYDALVALGAVIRGGTPHFDYVCRGVTDGVRQAMCETGVPIAFGVLTTDTTAQAAERAAPAGSDAPDTLDASAGPGAPDRLDAPDTPGGGAAHINKGEEAALAAVEMAHLRRALSAPPPQSASAPAPQPAQPQSARAKSAAPGAPQSAAPQSTASQSTASQSTASQSDAPQSAAPGAAL